MVKRAASEERRHEKSESQTSKQSRVSSSPISGVPTAEVCAAGPSMEKNEAIRLAPKPLLHPDPPYIGCEIPFLPKDAQVEGIFELGGVNYALYEGLQRKDPGRRQEFALACHACMLRNLMSCGMALAAEDLWVQIRPGVIGCIVLEFDRADAPTLLDADWPMRIRVVIRCAPEHAQGVSEALTGLGSRMIVLSEALRLYSQWFGRAVGSGCCLRMVSMHSKESSVDVSVLRPPQRRVQHVPLPTGDPEDVVYRDALTDSDSFLSGRRQRYVTTR
jgi:hypothetical protein